MTPTTNGWDGLRFTGQWRRYQLLALDAFDADRAARRQNTHVVAPPGSGKTIVGLEIARQLRAPALVLAPTTAIRMQWQDKLALFGAHSAPLQAYTYQAICQTSDPDGALAAAARHRLATERSADTGRPAHEILAEYEHLEGAAARRLQRDTATLVTSIKREIARGRHLDLAVEDLLTERAAKRVAALKAAGVRTVILDECHHLISMWGYLVRAVISALGDVHVIGLTATSPDEITSEEAELYNDLLGDVDFEIPTPAVVKDGYLAPFQELALFTTPLESEFGWLRERHVRFQELLGRLHDPPRSEEEDLAFPNWVISRIRYRDSPEGAQLSFAAFARRNPDLARAGLRYLHQSDIPASPDAPRGEGFSEPPDIDDWLVLLEDWALRCLRAHPGDAADRHWDRLAVGLADLGYTLTRRGIRPGRTDIDRVLVHSAAKPLLVCDALDTECTGRADKLRAVVLCDTEEPPRQPEDSPLRLSGGTRGLMAALAADPRTSALRPVMLTGRTVACLAADQERILAAMRTELPARVAAALRATPRGELVELIADQVEWTTSTYVPAVTRAFAAGAAQVLVGTRALLGEGWDCPQVNVLIDCTSIAASISVRQMRGRSLRLDPADPAKLASNWDMVCVAPDLPRGKADYRRFVRRHGHLHAPCEDGSIESGVSHVHPELSAFAPPPAGAFTRLNIAALNRAGDPDAARDRWRIGEAYRGVDLPVLLVRTRRQPTAADVPPAAPPVDALPARPLPGHGGTLGWVATAAAGGGIGVVAAGSVIGLAGLPLAAGLLAGGWRHARERDRRGNGPLALESAARAVLDAYVELGEIRGAATASLAFTARLGGYVRCALAQGTAKENELFSDALAEALDVGGAARYLVSREVAPGPPGVWKRLARGMLGGDDPLDRWHPVPAHLGRNRRRAEAYLRAWRRWVSPYGELRYAPHSELGQTALLESGGASPYATHRRMLWV